MNLCDINDSNFYQLVDEIFSQGVTITHNGKDFFVETLEQLGELSYNFGNQYVYTSVFTYLNEPTYSYQDILIDVSDYTEDDEVYKDAYNYISKIFEKKNDTD